MKNRKAAQHGINVVWFSCDQDNCDYKAKQAGNLKKHKRHIHNIGVVWHQYDLCEFKAKIAHHLKTHKQQVHNIGVSAIYAAIKQSQQASSNNTNN